MKTILDHFTNCTLFLLGLMHTVLTLINQRPFDLDALMYTGAGLAFIFVSIFNFARLKSNEPLTKLLSVVCNSITTLYIILIAAVFADIRVVVAIIALFLLLTLSFIDYKQSDNAS